MRMSKKMATLATAMMIVAACGSGTASTTTASQPDGGSSSTIADSTSTTTPSEGSAETLQLTIGSIYPTTGDLGTYGSPLNRASQLAVDHLNELFAGDTPAITASFAAADSESRAEGAVAAARKVIADGASCVMGPLTTPESIAVLNGATLQREMTMIPLASAAALREADDDGTIFRIIPPDSLQGEALAIVVEEFLDGAAGHSVAFAYQNSSYGQGLLDSFGQAWEGRGGEVSLEVGYTAEQQSYESEAQSLTAEEFDAYVFVDFPETFGKLGDALLRTAKFDPSRAFVADALAVSPIPDAISPEVLEGAHGVRGGSASGLPQQEAFDQLVREELGEDQRGTFDTLAFDGVMVCALAAMAANSTSPADITAAIGTVANAPGEKVTYLNGFDVLSDGGEIDYDGVAGGIEFGDNGDNIFGVYEQFQFVDGELVVADDLIELGQ